jgi:pimeloyl-ACP methyl ester carboxylesterase
MYDDRRMRSAMADVNGPVHYLEYDGPSNAPTIICLHALGCHHGTWVGLAPLLAERARVLVPDLIGFGYTPPAGRSAGLASQRAMLDGFIAETCDEPPVILGNSLGGAVALLQAGVDQTAVAGLVLMAPAIAAPRAYALAGISPTMIGIFASTLSPRVGMSAVARWLVKIPPERFVREMARVCTVDPTRVPAEVTEACLAVARDRSTRMPWRATAFMQATRSVIRYSTRPARFRRILHAIDVPTLLMFGSHDRLVPRSVAAAATAMRPDWDVIVLEELGHMPQIEDPTTTAAAIQGWLDAQDLA